MRPGSPSYRPTARTCLLLALACSLGAAASTASAAGDAASTVGPAAAPAAGEPSGEGPTNSGAPVNTNQTDTTTAAGTSDAGFGLPSFESGGLEFKPGFGSGCAPNTELRQTAGEPGITPKGGDAAAPAGKDGRYVLLSVAGSEIYSDNINRAPKNQAKSDFVTSVAPRLDACSQSGRVRGDLIYQLQGLVYANNPQYNHIYNDVQANTTIELISNHLFLDADTRYGQTAVDPSISFGQSNAVRPGRNQTSAWVSDISPYYLQSLGPLGQSSLRYRYGRSIYGNNNVPDATVNGVFFNLDSPTAREPLGYHLSVESQKVSRSGGNLARFSRNINSARFPSGQTQFDNSQTSHFDRATLELTYQLTPSLSLLGQGGAEDRYKRNGSNVRFGAPFWNVGFRYATASNSFETRIGHRFYGTSYQLQANHHGRVFDAGLEYREEPTNQSLSMLNGGGRIGSFGAGGFGSIAGSTNSLFDRGVYVEKRASAHVGFHTALTRTRITGYTLRRIYQQSNISESKRTGLNFESRYDFTRRMTLVANARWEHGNGGGSSLGGSYDNYEVGPTLIRSITPSAQAAIGYLHGWRRAGNGSNNYDENRVVLQFQKSF
ncbi:MAG: TIGR03016 family PEP-CTERM system-associated outer membrane protein [Salinisphaera sp.]|jgi:hypothetical protein|nr:TIGR03016 family PEP-CTERM system-associated outer membrane protein [Salinisphaera sp.]